MARVPIARLCLLAIASVLVVAGSAAAQANLSLTKVDSVDPVTLGTQFQYNITVTNLGPDKAKDVTIRDVLPAGVTHVSTTASGWSCSFVGSVHTCVRNADLNNGLSSTIRFTVNASTVGNWTNRANVTTTTADPVSSNNFANETTTIRTATPTGLSCFADSAGVHLDWNDVPQAAGYHVYRATGPSGSFVHLAVTATSDHLDTTAAVGQYYRYKVSSYSAVGDSPMSAECVIVSVPEFPTLFAGVVGAVGATAAFAWMRRRARHER